MLKNPKISDYFSSCFFPSTSSLHLSKIFIIIVVVVAAVVVVVVVVVDFLSFSSLVPIYPFCHTLFHYLIHFSTHTYVPSRIAIIALLMNSRFPRQSFFFNFHREGAKLVRKVRTVFQTHVYTCLDKRFDQNVWWNLVIFKKTYLVALTKSRARTFNQVW